tara:strand:- start:16614 stop:18629 length:2016 start_codon:yes stop_codon:yes gene_type:complete
MRLNIEEVDKIPTLCLNMIVKNESQVIIRLLSSVITIIDTYCICDTGSTDNTIELIKNFFEEHDIEGKIIQEPFKDFGYNRSYALKAAAGMSDYAILLDADMILEIKQFDKSILSQADSFCLLQGSEDFYYQNMRIVRNNNTFTYLGVTHEYVSTPPDNHNVNIGKDQLFINDVGDGGAKADKFERDIRLLKKGIEEEPTNVRYHFYLANSYKDNGNFDEAIEFYHKRIEMGDWEQEVWYSYYNIANIYEARNDMGNAILYWMKGYNHNPMRLENIHKIVQYYRMTGECKNAKLFYDLAQKAIEKGIKKDEYLFLSNDVYTYKFDYEFSIIACYLGIDNINDAVVKILNHCMDDSIITNTLSNMKFYKDVLPTSQLIDLTYIEHRNVGEMDKEFFSSSSCIIPNENYTGYRMNIRLVNYWINSEGGYLNCDDYIITNNKYLELDKNFATTKEKTFEVKFEEKRYMGIEDIRIFPDADDPLKLIYMGTSQHQDGKIGMLYGDYDLEKENIEYTEINPSFCDSWCEKNWVYFKFKGENHVIYKWSPVQICKVNKDSNELDMVELRHNMPKIFLHVRGSTPGFKYENEYWFVLHIVSYESPRHYYHIIATFDDDMNFKKHSAPFKFEGECIEYTLGLIVEKERVIIPYSTWDRSTKIAVYDKKMIDERIKYPLE